LLLAGFLCNALIRPVAEKYHYRELEEDAPDQAASLQAPRADRN